MDKVKNIHLIDSQNCQMIVQRLIAIWALSEATLGGVLHILKIPLTGIFINGSAVIIIVLIAYFANKKGTILKATLIVLLVKATVSPHTPLNAYLAVSLQGLIGEMLFFNNNYFKIKSIIFGVLTLFLSGIQRIIVVTILYGENLWESIDLFGNYVIQQLPFVSKTIVTIEISYWLIGTYVGLHLIIGFLIGIFAGKAPKQLINIENDANLPFENIVASNISAIQKKGKRKFWLKKPSSIGILVLATLIIVLTYIYPHFSETIAIKAVIMIARSIFIMLIWYLVVGPFFLKIYKNYIQKHGSKYSTDVDYTLKVLPVAKSIVLESWKYSKKYRNIRRFQKFILTTISNMLIIKLPENENNISVNRTEE